MNFFVVDFEFTQYRKHIGRPRGFFSEIIEIGAVKVCGQTNEIVGNIHNFVKPHFYPKQAKEIMEFCSITEADMKTAITFAEMLDKITELYIPNETYYVMWGTQDYSVIETGCERHNLTNPILQSDCLDLAKAYKEMHGDNYTTGLRAAIEENDITTEGHWHAAYDDAHKTGLLLIKLLQDGWTPKEFLEQKEMN